MYLSNAYWWRDLRVYVGVVAPYWFVLYLNSSSMARLCHVGFALPIGPNGSCHVSTRTAIRVPASVRGPRQGQVDTSFPNINYLPVSHCPLKFGNLLDRNTQQ